MLYLKDLFIQNSMQDCKKSQPLHFFFNFAVLIFSIDKLKISLALCTEPSLIPSSFSTILSCSRIKRFMPGLLLQAFPSKCGHFQHKISHSATTLILYQRTKIKEHYCPLKRLLNTIGFSKEGHDKEIKIFNNLLIAIKRH